MSSSSRSSSSSSSNSDSSTWTCCIVGGGPNNFLYCGAGNRIKRRLNFHRPTHRSPRPNWPGLKIFACCCYRPILIGDPPAKLSHFSGSGSLGETQVRAARRRAYCINFCRTPSTTGRLSVQACESGWWAWAREGNCPMSGSDTGTSV